MKLSPQDRDLVIRTVIGEAANQPDEGQAAVAHVIFNRLNAGKWGKTASDVVLAPNQFEPWQRNAKQLLSYAPDSPAYKRAAAIVDAATAGGTPDPTEGATHFLQPDIVMRRYGRLPGWARGRHKEIGDHVFFYGDGTGSPGGGDAAPVRRFTQDAPVKPRDVATDIADTDIMDTMTLLGLNPTRVAPRPAPAQPVSTTIPGFAPVEDADIQATAKELGLSLTPTNRAVPMPRPVPQSLKIERKMPAPSMTGQMLEGMPIVGPLMQKAMAASGAAISPVADLAAGRPTTDTFGERYARDLSSIQERTRQYARENPVKSLIGNLAGGTMLMGPLGATRVGGAMLGTYGPSLGSRILTGGAGMGTVGAIDALIRGENPVHGGVVGGVGGAGGPLVGEAASAATRGIVNVLPKTGPLRDLSNRTVKKLTGALEGETPESITAARRRMGPEGFLSDLNTTSTDMAGALADITGPAKPIVRGAYQQRAQQHAQRFDEALTDAMGPRTNIEDFRSFLTETRKAAADPLYEQWRSMKVQPTEKLKEMIPRLEKSGAFGMAEELSAISGEPINVKFFTPGAQKDFPTTQSWDYVKRGLDRRIDQAYNKNDKTLARELIKLKGEMIDEIGKTPAGNVWQQARKEFAERSALIDQLEAGRDTFLGGRSGTSVDELREELRHLSGPEMAARIVGARAAADEAMGATMSGDASLRAKLLAPNNRKKLELLLSQPRAARLIDTMEQERYLAGQASNVIGNIQTGASAPMRSQRVKEFVGQGREPWGFDIGKPGTYLPPLLRRELQPSNVMEAWRGQGQAQMMNQLAPLLTARSGSPEFNSLIRAIRREAVRRQRGAATGERVGGALTGLITLPGTTATRRQLPAR